MPLTLQLLPSALGTSSQVQPLTSYLINETIALDAGSLGFALAGTELAKIQHILLTHSHLDHIASLPIAIDTAYSQLRHSMCVHGLRQTLDAVHAHLFNSQVWVDFSELDLLGIPSPSLEFKTFEAGRPFELDGLRFTPIPVTHPVPTVGFIIESPTAAVLITSDTSQTDALWAAAKNVANLKAVLIECSFPDELQKLARESGHLTPKLVWEEISKLGRAVPTYCMHLKPSMRERILPQLAEYAGVGLLEIGKTYRWG